MGPARNSLFHMKPVWIILTTYDTSQLQKKLYFTSLMLYSNTLKYLSKGIVSRSLAKQISAFMYTYRTSLGIMEPCFCFVVMVVSLPLRNRLEICQCVMD